MLVHMVLIVRLLEIFLAHLVCAAVRGNPHIHARLGVGADLDALALDRVWRAGETEPRGRLGKRGANILY